MSNTSQDAGPENNDSLIIQGLQTFLEPLPAEKPKLFADDDSVQDLEKSQENSLEEDRWQFYLTNRPWLTAVESKRKIFALPNAFESEDNQQELSQEECRWAFLVMKDQAISAVETRADFGYVVQDQNRQATVDADDFDVSPEECRFAYYQICDVKLLRPPVPPSSSSIDLEPALNSSENEVSVGAGDDASVIVPEAPQSREYNSKRSLKHTRESQARLSLRYSSLDYHALLYAMLGLSIAESVLVGFGNHAGNVLIGQIVVLAFSSAAYIADIGYVSNRMVSMRNQVDIECNNELVVNEQYASSEKRTETPVCEDVSKFTLWDALIEHITVHSTFELLFLIYGWVTLFVLPQIATLRCFRLFCSIARINDLWESDRLIDNDDDSVSIVSSIAMVNALFRDLSRYFCRLGSELFTKKSQGGMAILSIFFFSAYVMAVVFWQLESQYLDIDENNIYGCGASVRDCFITMLRINFLDEGGLAYIASVTERGHGWMPSLLILYMCFTGIVLVSGLIGVFGVAMMTSSSLPMTPTTDIEFMQKIDSMKGMLVSTMQTNSDRNAESVRLESRLTKLELQLERMTRLLQLMRRERDQLA